MLSCFRLLFYLSTMKICSCLVAVFLAPLHPYLRNEYENSYHHSLTWSTWFTKWRKPKVSLCHIEETNPTKFSTIKVRNRRVIEHLALGDMRGSCSRHCDTLSLMAFET
mmetsp:Transcript_29263/g.52931  ORF Transcript_29263/g.52931 Transcript_29263/m.52931 type:complete len:109 (+) Transcript_29263:499-825(+)